MNKCMNKSYYEENGKIIVTDYNGNTRTVDNYDNINDILVQQNIIIGLDSSIADLTKTCDELEIPDNNGKKLFIGGGLTTIGALLLLGAISSISTGLIMIMIVAGTVFGANILMDASEKRTLSRFKRGLQCSIKFLTSKRYEEYAKLVELINNATIVTSNTNSNNSPVIKNVTIHNMDTIKDISDYSGICYVVGSRLEKIYPKYLNGTLNSYIKKERPDEINNIDKYVQAVEEIGPQYIDNFKHSKKY